MFVQASESSHALGGGWRLAGASVIGTSHLADGKVCQDAHGFQMLPGAGFVAAVSDGAGSAPLSDVGSRLAVETAVGNVTRALAGPAPVAEEGWSALLRTAFGAAADALAAAAAEREVPAAQLSATLLVVVVHPARSLVGAVGDCVAVVRDGTWLLPVPPSRGEYANETTFLTSPAWTQSLRIEFLAGPPDRVALFSDGLLRLALNLAGPAPHPPFFDSLFAFLMACADLPETAAALHRFLQSDRVNARTDDDKTLVGAWRET
jgi:hypothetical protein